MSRGLRLRGFYVFFFNDTATTEIYTLSLHDALPICLRRVAPRGVALLGRARAVAARPAARRRLGRGRPSRRSEEHTSELQSRPHLVCRLLLEKKNTWARTAAARQRLQRCLILRGQLL